MATIKPIVKFPSAIERCVFFDGGDNIAFYGLRYDAKSFSAVMDNAFSLGVTVKRADVFLGMFSGSGYASSVYGGNLCGASSMIFENVYDVSVGHSLVEEDGIVYALQGTYYRMVKTKTDIKTVLAKTADNYGNYYASQAGVAKLPDGSYILCITHSYYDKDYLFARYDSSLNRIHDFKVNTNYGTTRFLGVDGSNAYAMACGLNSYGRIIFYKYDSGVQAVTTLLDFNGAGKYMTCLPSQFIENPPAYDGKKVALVFQPQSQTALYYRAIVFDTASQTATKEDWTVDYGDLTEADVINITNSDRRQGNIAWITKHTTTDGDLWFVHLLFVSRNDYNDPASYYQLITYQIDWANKKLTYKSRYLFNQRVHSFLPLRSDYTAIMVLGASSTFSMSFNPTTAEWDSFTLDIAPQYVLYDSMGRLWLIDTSLNLYPLVRTAPAQVVIRLENPNVEVIDEPVDNNLLIDAYNYKGERVQASVTITFVSDNIEFADGTKSKTIQTSDTETTTVPVKITAGGFIDADVVFRAL